MLHKHFISNYVRYFLSYVPAHAIMPILSEQGSPLVSRRTSSQHPKRSLDRVSRANNDRTRIRRVIKELVGAVRDRRNVAFRYNVTAGGSSPRRWVALVRSRELGRPQLKRFFRFRSFGSCFRYPSANRLVRYSLARCLRDRNIQAAFCRPGVSPWHISLSRQRTVIIGQNNQVYVIRLIKYSDIGPPWTHGKSHSLAFLSRPLNSNGSFISTWPLEVAALDYCRAKHSATSDPVSLSQVAQRERESERDSKSSSTLSFQSIVVW